MDPRHHTPAVDGRLGKRSASSALLGVGMALTSATQLRAPGLPIGPGEVLLALWVFVAALMLLRQGAVSLTTVSRRFLVFWAVTLPTLLAGWIVGLALNVWDPASTRDAIAVALAASVTSLVLTLGEQETRIRRALTWLLATIGTAVSALLVLALLGRPAVGPVNALFGLRFAGWSLNPNQMALIVLLLPFFALDGVRRARRTRARAAYAALGAAALAIGVATLSDALFLAWMWGAGALAVWWWLGVVRRPARGLPARVTAVYVIPLAVAAALVVVGPRLADIVDDTVAGEYDNGDQGSDRVARWTNGLEAASYSPLVGLGPGSYSGPFTAFQGEEAHNTLIDWLDAAGVIGALALLVLCGWVAWHAVRSGNVLGAIATSSLFVFMMFHFVLRQPIFWFYLVAVAAMPRAERRASGLRAAAA